jgi:hypothetical protein
MTTHTFTAAELATLRQHDFVLFANRVIFDAQPPMVEADIAAVQAVCSGPISPELLELWRTTAGGSLDYDLSVEMNGNPEAISWTELFFNGSDGYHDLQGWIEHELEIAEHHSGEREVPWAGKLDALPVGGFEYCDRVYVVVKPGPHHGHIWAWKQGLPPAWTHRLHEDGIAEIGKNLHGAFAALHLSVDPLAPVEEYFAGETFLAEVSRQVEECGLDRTLADRLITFYRRAIVDWRPRLADGTLAADKALSLLALRQAIATDDAALVQQLAVAKVPLNIPVSGSALPVELALSSAKHNASQALIDAGAEVTARCLSDIHSAAPVSLLESLLAHGAEPVVDAVVACAEYGAIESANAVALACVARDREFSHAFADAKRRQLTELQETIRKVRDGKLGHYLTLEQLQQHFDSLTAYRLPGAG